MRAVVGPPSGPREVELRLHLLEPIVWWSYGGALILVGLLYIAAGLVAMRASPGGRLARSFAKLAFSIGFFVLTLFDLHTTRRLVPVFFAALAFVPGGFVLVALRLPDDAPALDRFPAIERIVDAVGLVVATTLVGLWAAGRPTTRVQAFWTIAMGAAQVFFVVTFVVRFARARGTRRAVLRSLFLPMVPPYLAAAGLLLFARLGMWKHEINVFAFPAFALAPLASVYALVRHDLWDSRALLTRLLAKGFAGAVACAIAIAIGTIGSVELGFPIQMALFSATSTTVLGALLVTAALYWTERRLFPSRAEYKPTIEQLSAELLSITSPTEVARAIERTVARWLPCDDLRLELNEATEATEAPSSASGSKLRVPPAVGTDARLTIPVEFEGRRVATLDVGQKRGGALFTRDDLDLLSTIANQGALALAHAVAYQELEQRRRQQAAAWRGEREALVETVAAEIAHEIRYPLNFFRHAFERLGTSDGLEDEDVDIGREEVERLERLVSGLRRVAAHRLDRKEVPVVELWARAEALLRDALTGHELHVQVPAGAYVRCDLDQITQVLVNLVANALDAAGKDGAIGIEWRPNASGAELSVWDSGAGFVGDPSRLFAPWYTTKPRGTGLGLAISHRLIRGHGWTISAARRDGRTVFTVAIPTADVCVRGAGDVSDARVA
ncbi:MAG: GAF domain-containing sensor histidine kinase [Myxococcales bacterium]|nr:GAF domain-containing sensor histidine kinase [Myxococcales bacterium]